MLTTKALAAAGGLLLAAFGFVALTWGSVGLVGAAAALVAFVGAAWMWFRLGEWPVWRAVAAEGLPDFRLEPDGWLDYLHGDAKLVGEFDGRRVEVSRRTRQMSRYTESTLLEFRLRMPSGFPVDLTVWTPEAAAELASRSVGESVDLGDALEAKGVSAAAGNARQAREVLDDPEVRRQLTRFVERYDRVVIQDGWLTVGLRGRFSDPERLDAEIRGLSEALEAFG